MQIRVGGGDDASFSNVVDNFWKCAKGLVKDKVCYLLSYC
jgi:hypothetical protein